MYAGMSQPRPNVIRPPLHTNRLVFGPAQKSTDGAVGVGIKALTEQLVRAEHVAPVSINIEDRCVLVEPVDPLFIQLSLVTSEK
jgi:hypothetical protein